MLCAAATSTATRLDRRSSHPRRRCGGQRTRSAPCSITGKWTFSRRPDLLGAAQKAYARAGKPSTTNPGDPYMTLLGYFNSLRELGGARRLIEDEVGNRLAGYASRRRVGEIDGRFDNRKIATDVVELTSRVSTDKVSEAKQRLASPFSEKDRVDVAI